MIGPIVITVSHFGIGRTTACGRTGNPLAGATNDAEDVEDVHEELRNRAGSPGEPTHVEGGSRLEELLGRPYLRPSRAAQPDGLAG